MDELSEGVPSSFRILMYTHSPGNNVGNTHYVWKIPGDISENELLRENLKATEQMKSQIKVYHSRAMRNEFKAICGRVSNMKTAIARELYNRFFGDASSAESMAESVVSERVRAFLDCEDEDIIWDLRAKIQLGPSSGTQNHTVHDSFYTQCVFCWMMPSFPVLRPPIWDRKGHIVIYMIHIS